MLTKCSTHVWSGCAGSAPKGRARFVTSSLYASALFSRSSSRYKPAEAALELASSSSLGVALRAAILPGRGGQRLVIERTGRMQQDAG